MMKRSFSESDLEEGDVFLGNQRDSDAVDNDTPEASARKRRRGQIEKKRRDRINSSLAELGQLVPAALRKQGSTKLEKAEILQLTVEHLRGLKYGAKYSKVPTDFAMTHASDSRTTGYEECIADGKPCLSPSADKSQTASSSPAKLQIINHFNWNNSTQSGQFSQPNSPLTSPAKVDLEPSSLWQSSGGFLAHLKQHEGCEGKKCDAHNGQKWGMSVSLNCPSMFPLQTPGLSNVFQAPFRQAVPLIDWSMALITKTNIATPFRTPWTP